MLNFYIDELHKKEKEINHLTYNLLKLKRKTCEHKNLFDTGFGRWTDKIRFVYRCKDCGKEILKGR